MNTVAIIPARGGSVGIPLKNIKELNGRPLISYMIRAALAAKSVDRVIVSTDHDEIADIAQSYEAEVPFKRPKNISGNKATTLSVLKHAIDFLEKVDYKVDTVVTLQPTTPLVTSIDIDMAIRKFRRTKADSVVSMCEVKEYPWWMMRYENHNLVPFISKDKGARQNLPKLYIPNGGIYVTKRDVVVKENRIYGKRCEAYLMPRERSVDIDDEFDFRIAEMLVKEGDL